MLNSILNSLYLSSKNGATNRNTFGIDGLLKKTFNAQTRRIVLHLWKTLNITYIVHELSRIDGT